MFDLGQNQDKAVTRAYIELIKAIDDNDGVECAQLPDVFFPDDWEAGVQRDIRLAKIICNQCPIRLKCLEYALIGNESYGIWGGLLPRERADLKRLAKLKTT
jgi:WhiB family transcriptional regulator, redox-sensing transcriptional regulator